jgi:choline dehydrogenase-like flavoprotein
VVNGVNQSWDVPNLFVPDGASFTSNSTVGPALTIMALAARSAAFIADAHATGELSKPTQDASI